MLFKSHKVFLNCALCLLLFQLQGISQNTPEHDAIISVERIWDRAAHNAFTSLIEFDGTMYCAFRESNGHVSDINGTIRVIASDDAQNWYSVAHIFEVGVDLRDPQLSISPDNRIMLNIAGSVYTAGKLEAMTPKVSFSDTHGKSFSSPQNILLDTKIKTGMDWLWRATWHKGKAYAGVYQPSKQKSVQLVTSEDGINYKYMTTFDVIAGNETTLRFKENDEMVALVRREGNENGSIGVSAPPYEKWQWKALETRLGGPDLIILENDLMLCATREYRPDSETRTIISKVATNGETTKLLTLPSGGDCSYAGLLWKDNSLYASYYSSHEEKTAIYLARIADLKNAYTSFEKVSEPYVSFDKKGTVKLACTDTSAKIKYTLDGRVPSHFTGQLYERPFEVASTTMLRAVALKSKTPSSKLVSQHIGSDIFQKALKLDKNPQNGLVFEQYRGKVKSTSEISGLPKIKTGKIPKVRIPVKDLNPNQGFIFKGFIYIQKDGTYTFYLSSNDGSRLYLDDNLAINNDGAHGTKEESVKLSLEKGFHKLSLSYFQLGGKSNLILSWSGDGFQKTEIPTTLYFH